MPKRKCFFEEPQKKRICSRISTGYTTSSKTGIPFRSSACHRSHRGRDLPTAGSVFGPRQDQDPRACDRGVRRMLTCMAHHPVDNSILHGMRRFARRSWRWSAKRAQAHATRPAPLPPASHPAPNAPRFRPTRTHPFRHPTYPSVRTHPATIPFPPAKPNQLRGINNLHAHTSHPSHPL